MTGSRHGVVHQAAADQLTFVIVKGVFIQRLTNTHGHPAMDLTGGQQRVNHPAAVVYRSVAIYANHASIWINFNLSNMSAVWKCEAPATVITQGFRQFAPTKLRLLGGLGYLLEGHTDIGFRRSKHAVGINHLFNRALYQFRRNGFCLVNQGKARALNSDASHLGRTGTAGAAPKSHHVGITLNDVDLLEVYAQGLAENLRVGSPMTLAVGKSAYDDIDAAILAYAYRCLFFWPAAAGFHVEADAPAPQHALGLAGLGALSIALPVAALQSHIQGVGKLAAADGNPRGQLVRHVLRSNKITLTQFDGVHAQLPGRRVEKTLHDVAGFRPTRTAISAHRHGVGKYAFHRMMHMGNSVHGTQNTPAGHGGDKGAGVGAIGAKVRRGLNPNPSDLAIRVEAGTDIGEIVATVIVAEKHFRAISGVLDGQTQGHCRVRGYANLGVHFTTNTKTAASVRGYHPNLV